MNTQEEMGGMLWSGLIFFGSQFLSIWSLMLWEKLGEKEVGKLEER